MPKGESGGRDKAKESGHGGKESGHAGKEGGGGGKSHDHEARGGREGGGHEKSGKEGGGHKESARSSDTSRDRGSKSEKGRSAGDARGGGGGHSAHNSRDVAGKRDAGRGGAQARGGNASRGQTTDRGAKAGGKSSSHRENVRSQAAKANEHAKKSFEKISKSQVSDSQKRDQLYNEAKARSPEAKVRTRVEKNVFQVSVDNSRTNTTTTGYTDKNGNAHAVTTVRDSKTGDLLHTTDPNFARDAGIERSSGPSVGGEFGARGGDTPGPSREPGRPGGHAPPRSDPNPKASSHRQEKEAGGQTEKKAATNPERQRPNKEAAPKEPVLPREERPEPRERAEDHPRNESRSKQTTSSSDAAASDGSEPPQSSITRYRIGTFGVALGYGSWGGGVGIYGAYDNNTGEVTYGVYGSGGFAKPNGPPRGPGAAKGKFFGGLEGSLGVAKKLDGGFFGQSGVGTVSGGEVSGGVVFNADYVGATVGLGVSSPGASSGVSDTEPITQDVIHPADWPDQLERNIEDWINSQSINPIVIHP